MGEEVVKTKAFSKMFKRPVKNWKNDIKVEGEDVDEDFNDSNIIQDVDCDEVEGDDEQLEDVESNATCTPGIKADLENTDDRKAFKKRRKSTRSYSKK